MSNKLYHNSGKNKLAGTRLPVSSSGKNSNPLAQGTMNTGGNKLAAPWEHTNLVFRTYEEGRPVVENLIKQVSDTLSK